MTNKYFLSRQAGSDVGMLQAMYDYTERFGAIKARQSIMEKLQTR